MSDFMHPKKWERLKDGLTGTQIKHLKDAVENAEALADPDGEWQHDLAAVCRTGSMIAWQLRQAFPFLKEDEESEGYDEN